jgi:hypothetical protein
VPAPVAYIAVVEISDAVVEKIGRRSHGHVSPAEVREAVVLCEVEGSAWVYDEGRGWRLFVKGWTGGNHPRLLRVVLYPVDEGDGRWRLATALADP